MDIPGLIRYDNVEELYDELPAEELFLVLRDEMRATKEDFKGHHSEIKAIKRDVRQLRRTVKSLRNSNTSWGSPCILEYGKGGNIERHEKSDGDSSPHWYEDLDEDDDSFLENSFLLAEDSLLDLTLQCTDDERERSKGKSNNYRKRLDFGENIEAPFSHNGRHSSLATLNQSQQPEPDSVLSTHKQENLGNEILRSSNNNVTELQGSNFLTEYTNDYRSFMDDVILQNFSDVCTGRNDVTSDKNKQRLHNNNNSYNSHNTPRAERKERRRRLREKIRSFSESTLCLHESITLLAHV